MKKYKILKVMAVLSAAAVMTIGAVTTAFAYGNWESDEKGTWWQEYIASWTYGEGSLQYPKNRWLWIDEDGNGTAECYYFNKEGYRVQDATTPDGYQVDANGRWVVNGVVQTTKTDLDLGHVANEKFLDYLFATKGTPVTDPNAVGKITQNHELTNLLGTANPTSNPLLSNLIKEPSVSRTYSDTYTYTTQYRGKPLEYELYPSGGLYGFYGTAGQLFNGIPEEGIELGAFAENTGYGRSIWTTTGCSDAIFNLPCASYRYSTGETLTSTFDVLLTQGTTRPSALNPLISYGSFKDSEGNWVERVWYIYPDSKVWMTHETPNDYMIEHYNLQP